MLIVLPFLEPNLAADRLPRDHYRPGRQADRIVANVRYWPIAVSQHFPGAAIRATALPGNQLAG